jgi:single-stranded-DNA-specific exonuclease
MAQVLLNRGLTSREEAEVFVRPDYRQLADPFLMLGMAEATERIQGALAEGERITVYGDFDADGVTGTALLVQALRRMGARVEPYIPQRIEEGYGLNLDAVQQLAEQGTTLLITVDCGISNLEEVAAAQSLGMDVIVTDHHHTPAELPPALAILNPRQPGCPYPFKRLAGVGIAFVLVRGLVKAGVSREGLRGRDLLDLVALGTVADVSPLSGENRILVAHGLKAIRRTERMGLRALMGVAGVTPTAVGAGTIGFVLGPRLNAAGRLRHAIAACNLMLAETAPEAASLARELDSLNRERQELTAAVLEKARERVLQLPQERKLILLADSEFPAGVVGLVAGKLTEEFHRPTLLIEQGETESRGSARSIPGFHVTHALTECADLLTRFGGHRLAAGFSVPNENIPALETRLLSLADTELDEDALTPTQKIDAEARLNDLSVELARELERLAPFGIENPRPVFLCSGVSVMSSKRVGAERNHLQLHLGKDGLARRAIAFRLGERQDEFPDGSEIDLVCTLEASTWRGKTRPELKVRDLRPASGG